MGLGSFIGTALGGMIGGGSGAVIAQGIGGLLGEEYDNRRAEKKNLYNDSQRFIRLRQAAEAGGFHPLEALRAGGAAPAQSQPRLMSATAAANAHDGLKTFMDARREETNRAKDEAEKARNAANASVLGSGIGKTPIADPGRRTVVSTGDTGSKDYSAPWSVDAETAEARYSEVGGFFKGISNWFTDNGYQTAIRRIATARGETIDQLHEQYSQENGKDLYMKHIRELLAVPTDDFNDLAETPSPRLGRLNTTTNDLRSMPKPWDHNLWQN